MYMVARRYQYKTQNILLGHHEKLLLRRQIFQTPLFLLTERKEVFYKHHCSYQQKEKPEILQVSWFNPGQQLNPAQPLAHSPVSAQGREVEEK